MTSNKEMSDPTAKQARRRKVAAVLAGGLVLGVGTMATLASWNDSEFANATFTAGTFKLVGSTDKGANWGDHATTPGALLTFTTPFSNLTPTDSVYSAFALRLAAGTTNNATVTITGSSGSTGSVANLTYQLVKTPTSTCDASAVTDAAPADVLVGNSAVGSATDAKTFDLAKGALATDEGTTQYLCFKVTAGASLVQGQSGQGIWQFQAESH